MCRNNTMQTSCKQLLIASVLLTGGLFAHALPAEEAPWSQQADWSPLPVSFSEPQDAALNEVLQVGHSIILCEAQSVAEEGTLSKAAPPQLLVTPAAAESPVEDGEPSATAAPEDTFSLFGTPRHKSESTTVPDVPEDIFAEFETLAFWTGMVVLLAIAGLFILKYRLPDLQGLATNGRLKKLAQIQLRPDAQLLLVVADDQRYLIALDRQGIKSLQPVSAWSDLAEGPDRDVLAG